MGSFLFAARVALLALSLGGDGILNEGDPTTLPVSPNAGLPTLEPQSGEAYASSDAGLIWAPPAENLTSEQLAGTSAPDAGPTDAGAPTGPCAPLQQQIAHRRAYITGVGQKAQEVGWQEAAHAYCEQHPGEIECARPPIAIERSLDELTVQDPTAPPLEADAWIIRWQRELARCEATHKPAPTAKKKPAKR